MIRLAAFVKGKALGYDKSLKVRWMKFKQLLFAVHMIQPSMLPCK
jgi:hypothetical protein